MKKNILRIFLIILIILWIISVFGFSNENAKQSSGLSLRVARLLSNNDENVSKVLEPVIRKLAHLFEYTVGRIFVLWFIFNI